MSIHHCNPAYDVRRAEPAVRDTDQEGLRLRRVLPCDQQQRLDHCARRAGSARGTGHILFFSFLLNIFWGDFLFFVNRKKEFVSSVGNQTCKKPAEIRIKSKEKEAN
jgi:hypothetical protein